VIFEEGFSFFNHEEIKEVFKEYFKGRVLALRFILEEREKFIKRELRVWKFCFSIGHLLSGFWI